MLRTAVMANIKPAEFWEMTPAELIICVEGHVATHIETFKESVTTAYMNAAWQRAKKMPRLESVLRKIDGKVVKEKKKAQTPEEMMAIAKAITNSFNKAR